MPVAIVRDGDTVAELRLWRQRHAGRLFVARGALPQDRLPRDLTLVFAGGQGKQRRKGLVTATSLLRRVVGRHLNSRRASSG
jgi:hypothetical protein